MSSLSHFRRDLRIVEKTLQEASDQMTKLTGPPLRKQSGGSSASKVLSIVALNLFQKDPNDLFDFLHTLALKYTSVISHDSCDLKAKEKLLAHKQKIKTLKAEVGALKKEVTKNHFRYLFSMFSKKNKYVLKEVKDLKTITKQKQKEISELKTATYESILKNLIACEESRANSHHASLVQTIQSALSGFNTYDVLLDNQKYTIYYLREPLQKKNSFIQFTSYIVLPHKRVSDANFKNLTRKLYEDNNMIQINRYFLLNGKNPVPEIGVFCKDPLTNALLREDSSFEERKKLYKAISPLMPAFLKGFSNLSAEDIKKYLFLFDYSTLSYLRSDHKFDIPPKEPKNVKHSIKLLDGNLQDLRKTELFPFVAHFQIEDFDVFLVNLADMGNTTNDSDDNGVSMAYNHIVEYLLTPREREDIANILWEDIHSFLQSRSINTQKIFLERSYYITNIPGPSFCQMYPTLKSMSDSIIAQGGSRLHKSLWIISEDLGLLQ